MFYDQVGVTTWQSMLHVMNVILSIMANYELLHFGIGSGGV